LSRVPARLYRAGFPPIRGPYQIRRFFWATAFARPPLPVFGNHGEAALGSAQAEFAREFPVFQKKQQHAFVVVFLKEKAFKSFSDRRRPRGLWLPATIKVQIPTNVGTDSD
jgi:hypothetical protein